MENKMVYKPRRSKSKASADKVEPKAHTKASSDQKGRSPGVNHADRKPKLGGKVEAMANALKSLKTSGEGEQGLTAHSAFLGTFGMNPSGSAKELVIEYVDFFDYDPGADPTTAPFKQYKFNPNFNNLVNPALNNPTENISRVNSVTLWALPQFAVSTVESSVAVDFGVPVHSVSDAILTATPSLEVDILRGTASQKSTLLTPTSVSDWVKVGHWSYDKLFAVSNYNPVYDSLGNQCLFTFTVVKPDNGVASAQGVQFMVEIEASQTLPPMSGIEVGRPASNNPTAWYNAVAGGTGVTPAFVRLKGLRNTI